MANAMEQAEISSNQDSAKTDANRSVLSDEAHELRGGASLRLSVDNPDRVTPVSPIDLQNDICQNADPTRNGILTCIQEAQKGWDKELNVTYSSLMETLSPQSAQILRESERAWLTYRDTEFRLIDDQTINIGAESAIGPVERKMEIVKQRAQELQDLLSSASE